MNQKIHFPILTTAVTSLLIRYLYPKSRTEDQQPSQIRLKHIAILLLSILAIPAYGQDKSRYLYANSPVELNGTEYVLSRFEHVGKMFSVEDRYLLFINTRNGQSKKVYFPDNGRIQSIQEIKIDALQINKVLLAAHLKNVDEKHFSSIYPTQLILLSVDGEEKVPLTEERFFARSWEINNTTGNIVVTGYYDVNGNGKLDAADEYQMLLYDLRNAKLISKINL